MITDSNIPTRASEILISKICHDLVSPVGAVNNGIEFLADMGGADDGLQDGLGLIEHSARQAAGRLQLFRMCYGAGGSDAKVTGKMIYETDSLEEAWNGRVNNTGKQVQEGVYVCLVTYTGPRGEPIEYKGYATVLR